MDGRLVLIGFLSPLWQIFSRCYSLQAYRLVDGHPRSDCIPPGYHSIALLNRTDVVITHTMDHIPLPYKRPRVLPSVKLCTDGYDHGTFMGYLKRIGWVVEKDIIDLGRSSKSRDEVHRVLQTWLYFGILHEATGMQINVEDFRKDVGGDTFLSSSRLTILLEDWIQEPAMEPQAWVARVQNLSDCL